jgi:hypothetical protein
MGNTESLLVNFPERIELVNAKAGEKRADYLRRFPITGSVNAPLQTSAEVRTEGVTDAPGIGCSIFFNLEYDDGPIFWDTFLYPDTSSTPWRTLRCEVRARGALRGVELHVRFHQKGKLLMRNLGVETIEPWRDDAAAGIVVARSVRGSSRGRARLDNPTGLKGDLHPNAYGSQMIDELYFERLKPIMAGLLDKR